MGLDIKRLTRKQAGIERELKERVLVGDTTTTAYRNQLRAMADECVAMCKEYATAQGQVKAVLGMLDGYHRRLLEMRYIDGLSVTEIGQQLCIDRTTVWRGHTEAMSCYRAIAGE